MLRGSGRARRDIAFLWIKTKTAEFPCCVEAQRRAAHQDSARANRTGPWKTSCSLLARQLGRCHVTDPGEMRHQSYMIVRSSVCSPCPEAQGFSVWYPAPSGILQGRSHRAAGRTSLGMPCAGESTYCQDRRATVQSAWGSMRRSGGGRALVWHERQAFAWAESCLVNDRFDGTETTPWHAPADAGSAAAICSARSRTNAASAQLARFRGQQPTQLAATGPLR